MAWLRQAGEPQDAVSPLVAALRANGVREAAPASPVEPGIVLLGRGGVWRAAGAARIIVVPLPGVDIDPWQLLDHGATDVIRFDPTLSVDTLLARLNRWAEVDAVVDSEMVRAIAVGTSPRWTTTLREVVEVARFTQSPLLLTGETGTGKEVIARLIHRLDQQAKGREMVVLDCQRRLFAGGQ